MKEIRLARVVDYSRDYSTTEKITILVGTAEEVKAYYGSMRRGLSKTYSLLGAKYCGMPKFNPSRMYAIAIDWQERDFFVVNSDSICWYLYDFAVVGHTNR